MKATIKAVSETQDPLETFFGGGNPLVYQRNDRMVWVKVQDEDQQQPKVINQDNRSDAPILEKPQQNLVRLH